jgi:hypothetical protein
MSETPKIGSPTPEPKPPWWRHVQAAPRLLAAALAGVIAVNAQFGAHPDHGEVLGALALMIVALEAPRLRLLELWKLRAEFLGRDGRSETVPGKFDDPLIVDAEVEEPPGLPSGDDEPAQLAPTSASEDPDGMPDGAA